MGDGRREDGSVSGKLVCRGVWWVASDGCCTGRAEGKASARREGCGRSPGMSVGGAENISASILLA